MRKRATAEIERNTHWTENASKNAKVAQTESNKKAAYVLTENNLKNKI